MPPATPVDHPLFTPTQLQAPLYPADILLVRGTGWVSERILNATRSPGEPPSRVSHVALVTAPGTLETAVIHEAAGRHVREVKIGDIYRGGQGLAVMRFRGISPEMAQRIVWRVQSRRGERYGFADIGLHLLARTTGWSWPRRLVGDRTPVCSQLLDYGWRIEGVSFMAINPQPDDIDDAGRSNTRQWQWPMGQDLRRLPLA